MNDYRNMNNPVYFLATANPKKGSVGLMIGLNDPSNCVSTDELNR